MIIDQRIKDLRNDLYSSALDHEQIFQKHIIDVNSFLFQPPSLDQEYQIRKLVANYLGVHLNEVLIVGSSKLGYSLSPLKLYNKFDSKFLTTNLKKDKSDIDIAVVSNELFLELKKNLYNFTDGLKLEWDVNEYYKNSIRPITINYKLYEYICKGWFRPDFKPIGFEICKNGTFEELKQEIYSLSKRKLGLAIYENWFFFKSYHLNNLNQLKLKLKTEVI